LFNKAENPSNPYEGITAFIYSSRNIEFRLSSNEQLVVEDAVTSWATANHLAFVRRGNVLELYVNGVQKGTLTVAQYLNVNNAAPFRIGGNHAVHTDQSLMGVGIWNIDAKTRAMSSAEIAQVMSGHREPSMTCNAGFEVVPLPYTQTIDFPQAGVAKHAIFVKSSTVSAVQFTGITYNIYRNVNIDGQVIWGTEITHSPLFQLNWTGHTTGTYREIIEHPMASIFTSP
jgi:hypothetical protein